MAQYTCCTSLTTRVLILRVHKKDRHGNADICNLSAPIRRWEEEIKESPEAFRLTSLVYSVINKRIFQTR